MFRYQGAQLLSWTHGACCPYRLSQPGFSSQILPLVRCYSSNIQPTNSSPPEEKGGAEVVKQRTLAVLQHVSELGKKLGQTTVKSASATANYWWERYEEFVGLNEVRDAQAKVTQAETDFLVARGMVRESHANLESLQERLKEVRNRLDRVARDEAHYLELATQEHKLLQEERKLVLAYQSGEVAEREKFSLFSACVRESHEKERSRAERTKNWSIIGSVLGTLIGVMGSTYINRVRLQELKSLLLEAQKGPESLQEALKVQAANHHVQQDELRSLIGSFRLALSDVTPGGVKQAVPPAPMHHSPSSPRERELKELAAESQRTQQRLLESLEPQLGLLQQGVGRLEDHLCAVRGLVEARTPPSEQQAPAAEARGRPAAGATVLKGVEESHRRLGQQISRSSTYNAVVSLVAAAVTVPVLYILLKGS